MSRPHHAPAAAALRLSRAVGTLVAPVSLLAAIGCTMPSPSTATPPSPSAIPDALTADPAFYSVEFENAEVRVLRIRYGPHARGHMHDHPRSVTVFLTAGRLRGTTPGRSPMEATVTAGSVVWEDAGPHQIENLSDQPFEAIRTEFKTKPAAAR